MSRSCAISGGGWQRARKFNCARAPRCQFGDHSVLALAVEPHKFSRLSKIVMAPDPSGVRNQFTFPWAHVADLHIIAPSLARLSLQHA